MDEGPRADTSLEALAKLKPAFHAKGVVTAGNSVADFGWRGRGGGACLRSGRRQLGIKPLARLCLVCVCAGASRRDGHRAGVCDSEGAEAGGADAGSRLM